MCTSTREASSVSADGQVKFRADSRFAPSQWETALLCNAVSHWLGTSLESALKFTQASQLFVWHIEAWLKWPPFSRRYLQMNFFQWKCFNFEYKMIEKCFWGFNNRWQNSIGAVSAAGHRIGAKPLLEPMLTNYPNPVDAYPGQVFVLYTCICLLPCSSGNGLDCQPPGRAITPNIGSMCHHSLSRGFSPLGTKEACLNLTFDFFFFADQSGCRVLCVVEEQ